MPKIHSNGINIYHEVHGAGDPLVLIGGLGYDIWQWHKMVPGLAANNQVVIFDNRGAGQTDAPKGPYTDVMLADDTVGLIQALGLDTISLLGFSMGGIIAQNIAFTRPEVVNKLILAATAFGGPNEVPMPAETVAILGDFSMDPLERARWGIDVSTAPGFREANPEFSKEWVKYMMQRPISLEAYNAQMAIGLTLRGASVEDSYQPKLGKITAPTLIMFGEADRVMPPENAELLAKEIRNSQVEILPNAGHFFAFDNPDLAVSVIDSFLHG
jgi:pimeloyl-ACP methyl ester carboxylesterase